jgi:CBS domain-containing protein
VLEELGPALSPHTTLEVAAHEYFLRTGCDALPVGSEDRPTGMVELRRLRDLPRDQWPVATVDAIVTPRHELPVVSWAGDLGAALTAMASSGSEYVLVEDEAGGIRGRITREAIARFLRNRQALTDDPS